MAFGYRYTLAQQENGWWLVRFVGVPEALTEGETEEEARANARDCLIMALEGYMKAGRPLPRKGAGHSGRDRAVLPSLVTAKLAVYEEMRARGWSRVRLAKELGMSENSVRRLLDLHHSSHMWIIDEALAKMNAELSIDLPNPRPSGKAAQGSHCLQQAHCVQRMPLRYRSASEPLPDVHRHCHRYRRGDLGPRPRRQFAAVEDRLQL